MQRTVELEQGTFTIREYREDDEKMVLDLWKLAFGKELSRDLWRWKYVDNPLGSVIYLCLDQGGGPAVVMYGGVPYPARCSGRDVVFVQLMDIMSHPDYRKTGLFVKSAHAYYDHFGDGTDCPFVYGFPGQYHFDIGSKYLSYVRLDSGMAYLEASAEKLAGSAGRLGGLLGGKVDAIQAVDARFDDLWERYSHLYPLSAVRNREFLQWRFMDHPSKTYRVFTLGRPFTGTLGGYAVLAAEGATARIVDIFTGDNPMEIKSLLGGVGRQLLESGTTRVCTWLPGNHFITEGSLAAGFERVPEPLGLIPTVSLFDKNLDAGWVSDRLYYTMADCDVC